MNRKQRRAAERAAQRTASLPRRASAEGRVGRGLAASLNLLGYATLVDHDSSPTVSPPPKTFRIDDPSGFLEVEDV